MALINTTTTGVLGTTVYGDGAGALTVQKDGVTQGVYGNIPAFSAYLSNGVSLTHAQWTKIICDVKEFDTSSCYSTSTGRFTPNVTGYYQINVTLGTPGNAEKAISIYKNGSSVKQTADFVGWIASSPTLMYFNGTTDYIEIYLYQGTGSTQTSYSGVASAFQAFLVKAV